MEKVVLAVVVITAAIAWASGASVYAAAISGLFWGAIAWGILWARARIRGRRAKSASTSSAE